MGGVASLRPASRRLTAAGDRDSRPGELAGHDLAVHVLFEFDQDDLLTRLEVTPLGRRGMAELTEAVIKRPARRALVDWICERSQGIPLFAIGLLRALMEDQDDLSVPHLVRLPGGLTERVTSELRRLDAAPQSMLELLAVVGRPVSIGDLTVLTGATLEEVGPILGELVNAGIVVEEEWGTDLSYELHHPLVRDVIYQATGGARRRMLHRQAARSLLGAAHLAEAALHFARSAERGDSEAVEVLLDAMRRPSGARLTVTRSSSRWNWSTCWPPTTSAGSRCWMRCTCARSR